jgi:hypothetical protein
LQVLEPLSTHSFMRIPKILSTVTSILLWGLLFVGLFAAFAVACWQWDQYMRGAYTRLSDPDDAIGLFAHEFAGFTALCSALSFAGVLFTIVFQCWQAAKQAQVQQEQLALNLSPIVTVELKLAELPSAIRFHGITEQELAAHDIAANELAYVVASFTAGRIYHEARKRHITAPFDQHSERYRYQMCISAKTRKAWPLVKRMMNQSSFVERIEATIRQAEEAERAAAKAAAKVATE